MIVDECDSKGDIIGLYWSDLYVNCLAGFSDWWMWHWAETWGKNFCSLTCLTVDWPLSSYTSTILMNSYNLNSKSKPHQEVTGTSAARCLFLFFSFLFLSLPFCHCFNATADSLFSLFATAHQTWEALENMNSSKLYKTSLHSNDVNKIR